MKQSKFTTCAVNYSIRKKVLPRLNSDPANPKTKLPFSSSFVLQTSLKLVSPLLVSAKRVSIREANTFRDSDDRSFLSLRGSAKCLASMKIVREKLLQCFGRQEASTSPWKPTIKEPRLKCNKNRILLYRYWRGQDRSEVQDYRGRWSSHTFSQSEAFSHDRFVPPASSSGGVGQDSNQFELASRSNIMVDYGF